MSEETLSFSLKSLTDKHKRRARLKTETPDKKKTTVYRILPPFGANHQGSLSARHNVHWITGPTGNKMTVQCTYFVEGACPICAVDRQLQDEIKRAEVNKNEKLIEELKLRKQEYSVDRKDYYNAINASGEFVVLKLNSVFSKALDEKIGELVEKNKIDPINVKTGVRFTFTVTGNQPYAVKVEVESEMKDVPGFGLVPVPIRTPLTEEQVKALDTSRIDVHSRDALYIRQYTAKQLGDFLNGEPLPDLRAAEPAASSTTASTSEGSSEPTESTSAPAAEAPKASAPAAETPQASAPTETAPKTTSASMSRLEELRAKARTSTQASN